VTGPDAASSANPSSANPSSAGPSSAGPLSAGPPAVGPTAGHTAPRALLATASVAVALAAADTYVVVLALTDMMAGVGLGVTALQQAAPIISGFLLGYVAVLPLIGRIADLTSRQRVLLGCLGVFVVGSAVTALAVELPVLVTGRLIQGMGGGGLVPTTLALVADLWPPGRRGMPLGLVGAVQELGSVLGPLLGAAILAVADWRWIFWLNALAGLVLLGVVALLSARHPAAGSAGEPSDGGGGSVHNPPIGQLLTGKSVHKPPIGRLLTRRSVHNPPIGQLLTGKSVHNPPIGQLLTGKSVHKPPIGQLWTRRSVHNPPIGQLWTGASTLVAMLTVVGLALLVLALAAPEALTTSVTWGIPFIPLGTSASRVATPIGVIALALLALALALWLRRSSPVLRQADLLGALLLGTALGAVILTFAAADPQREVVGPWGLVLLPVGGVASAAYLIHHRRAAHPLVPRGLIRGRAAWALVVSAAVGVALVAVVVDVPLLARLVHTDSETGAAFVLVRFLVAVPVGALCGGWLLRWTGDGLVAAGGLLAAASGLAFMTTWGRGSLDTGASVAVLAAVGFGVGLALAPVNNAALARVPEAAHGTVSALVVVARMVGMVVGLALLTAVGLHAYYAAVAALPDPTDTRALVDAGLVQVHWVFRGAALAAGLGAVVALLLGVRRPSYAAARHTHTVGL